MGRRLFASFSIAVCLRLVPVAIGVAIGMTTVSCSKFRKIQKSEDWRIKYDAGLNYYAKKDYYRTALLFEEILPVVRGLPEGEKVEFYLAYCQYYERTYPMIYNYEYEKTTNKKVEPQPIITSCLRSEY